MDLEALRSCVESHYPILYLVTFEDELCDQYIRSIADGRTIFEWNLALGCVDFETKRGLTRYLDLPAALSNYLDQGLNNHFVVIRDAHLVLRDSPLAISRLRMLVSRIVYDNYTKATIFLVSSQAYVAPELAPFITVFDQEPPDEQGVRKLIDDHARAYEYDIKDDVAKRLVVACRGLSEYEIKRLLNRGYQKDGIVGDDDVRLVYEEKRQIVKKSGILEMVSSSEGMEEVGGLDNLKDWLTKKNKVMANLAEANEFGVDTPKGMMIAGMPGCGKSLTAKATSKLFDLPLLGLDVGALMGRYVGDSEANMRRALHLAETVSPCVLWVDELEKAFAGIGGGGAGSEVTSRLFGYFLTWMQEKTKPVFVVATANDISVLPPELLRRGRFDEIFYCGLPNPNERRQILAVHLKKRSIDVDAIDLTELVMETDSLSGADLEGIVKDAIERAFVEGKRELLTKDIIEAIGNKRRYASMIKDRAMELHDKYQQMGIRNAS